MKSAKQKQTEIITELGPHDVLLGRGTGPNQSAGNKRFRAMVAVVIEVSGLTHLDRWKKTKFTEVIMAQIKKNGGRFVKVVVNPPGSVGKASIVDKGDDKEAKRSESTTERVYKEVSDAVASEKVKHSLRDHIHSLFPQRKSASSGPANKTAQSSQTIMESNRPFQEPTSTIPCFSLPPSASGSASLTPPQLSAGNSHPLLSAHHTPEVNAFLGARMAAVLRQNEERTLLQLRDLARSMVPTSLPPVAMGSSAGNIALHLHHQKELALLQRQQEALLVRRNLEEQMYLKAKQQQRQLLPMRMAEFVNNANLALLCGQPFPPGAFQLPDRSQP